LLAWLVTPLTALPYAAAAVLWLIALGVCFGLTWLVASAGPWPTRIAQLFAALALLPIFIGLEFGQASVLVVGAVALAWWLIRRGHPLLAGVALAFLAFKPQVAFLVPVALLAAGYWRVVAAWLATTLTLAGLSFVAVGTAGFAGIRASLSRAQGLGGPLQVSVWHVVPSVAIAALVAAAGLCLMIVIAYRSRHTPQTPIAVGLLATMLVSPYVNYYDLAALVLAAWLVLRTNSARWQGITLLALYLPVFLAPLWPVPVVVAECLWLLTFVIRLRPVVRTRTLERAA
jgi:alpha-1,2-mannosyltransferase